MAIYQRNLPALNTRRIRRPEVLSIHLVLTAGMVLNSALLDGRHSPDSPTLSAKSRAGRGMRCQPS